MYSGSFPWRGMSHERIIDNVVAGGKLLFHPDALPRYALLASACMAYKPGDRPASFSSICEVLCAMDPDDCNDCCAVAAAAAIESAGAAITTGPQQQGQMAAVDLVFL